MTICFTTPAILLRRVDFGDNDLILTFFSQTRGKISLIAKSARKSRKRFCGALDLFSVFDLVCSSGRGRLPVLQETSIKHPFCRIRSDFKKTAYACYFVEIINNWMEPDVSQPRVFDLLYQVLERLDRSDLPDELLSIVFQMTLMIISGFSPNFSTCCHCHADMDCLNTRRIGINFAKGGLICSACNAAVSPMITLSRGTIKQLQWMGCGNWNKIARARFSDQSIQESLGFLEAFVPYHLGKEPKSLSVLRQFRNEQINRRVISSCPEPIETF
jgi:DNA repair protein RecO (recombination protein O)